MTMKMRTGLAMALIWAGAVLSLSAQGAPSGIRIGVFDADSVGGQSFGEQGTLQALAKVSGLHVVPLKKLDSKALAGLDVLILPDVHKVGEVREGWQQSVRRFVTDGKGVLMTHDCAGMTPEKLFPEISRGTTRHVSRAIKPVLEHPVVKGVLPFECRFGDHKDVIPGPSARILLRCSGDRIAGVVGEVGKGRVLHIGVAIGLDGTAGEAAPNEDETRLLLNAVAWLAGKELTGVKLSPLRIAVSARAVCQPAPVVAEVRWLGNGMPGTPCKIIFSDSRGDTIGERLEPVTVTGAPGRRTGVARAEFATKGLADGSCTLRASVEGHPPTEVAVLLEGQARSAMHARDKRIRARHRNQVIKFAFTQGYEFRKGWAKAKPFLEALKAHNIDSFDYYLLRGGQSLDDGEFERFERMCGLAAEVGLQLWATFLPPSGKRELAALDADRGRALYREAFQRLARLSLEHPHFIGITIDDFDYNLGFFSPEFCAELAAICRSGNPDLAFMPLMYWRSISPGFVKRYEPYIDGIVFHFRAGSDPPSYLPGYDPKSFDDYRQVLHYELSRVRRMLGGKTLICGFYQWYYKGGWGVMTPDGKNPSDEHQCADVLQKYEVAHEYADGVRLYGLGIDYAVYDTLRDTVARWREEGSPWGWRGTDVEEYQPSARPVPDGKKLATIIQRGYGVVELARRRGWVRQELYQAICQAGPAEQVLTDDFPLVLASRTAMRKAVASRVEAYVRRGGVLFVQGVPGWRVDTDADPLREGEERIGNNSPGTSAFARLAGVRFRYHPRGFVTRVRVVADHPAVKALPMDTWRMTCDAAPRSNYPYLAYPVVVEDSIVLIEAEHEECPYNGVEYARTGKIRGTFPFLTVRQCGKGAVVRWYAHCSPAAVLGKEWFETIAGNVFAWAEKRADDLDK